MSDVNWFEKTSTETYSTFRQPTESFRDGSATLPWDRRSFLPSVLKSQILFSVERLSGIHMLLVCNKRERDVPPPTLDFNLAYRITQRYMCLYLCVDIDFRLLVYMRYLKLTVRISALTLLARRALLKRDLRGRRFI